jgi:hypothetical protein
MIMTPGPYKAVIPNDSRKPITIETADIRHEGAVGGTILAQVNHHGVGRLQARKNAVGFAVAPEVLTRLEKLVPCYVQDGRSFTSPATETLSSGEIQALWIELAGLLRAAEAV